MPILGWAAPLALRSRWIGRKLAGFDWIESSRVNWIDFAKYARASEGGLDYAGAWLCRVGPGVGLGKGSFLGPAKYRLGNG